MWLVVAGDWAVCGDIQATLRWVVERRGQGARVVGRRGGVASTEWLG